MNDWNIRAGIRFDYFDPNTYVPGNISDPLVDKVFDPTYPLYLSASNLLDRLKNPKKTDTKFWMSPRISASYPIKKNLIFNAAYGYYSNLPAFEDMFYNNGWSLLNKYNLMGNPDLKLEKIAHYEAGFFYSLDNIGDMNISLYYKNLNDIVGEYTFRHPTFGTPFWVKANMNRTSVVGLETSIKTIRWENIVLNLNYLYQKADGNFTYDQGLLEKFRD